MFSKKLLGFFLIVLIFAISTGAIHASDNTTQLVDESQDNVEKSFDDIQNAIDKAIENDTIELEGTYTSKGKEIFINKTVTITSKNGATLNAGEKSSVFNISNANVVLDNLNIINSKSEIASAIYSAGNLTVSNSRFINNTADIKIIYYSFNDPEEDIDLSAGAIYSAGSLTITNSTFENNIAIRQAYEHEYFEYYTLEWGGAVYSKGTLSINECQFRDDEIISRGNLRISDSRFKNSRIISNGNATITNSIFNKTENTVITFSQTLELTNCSFTNNAVQVILDENPEGDPDLLTVKNCIFSNNSLLCGGLYDFEDEEMNWEYPVIELNNVICHVYNSLFENNTENAINSANTVFIDNSTFLKNNGPAIKCEILNVTDSIFTNNTGTLGGAVNANKLYLTNCNFTDNIEGAITTYVFASVNADNYTGLAFFNNDLKQITLVTVTAAEKFSTVYYSGETLAIKAVYTETGHPYANYINIDLMKGKKIYYSDYGLCNSKGIWKFKASKVPAGTYTAIITYDPLYETPQKTITVKIKKARTSISAPKVTNKYKKSAYFKVKVNSITSSGKCITFSPVKKTYVKLTIGKKTYKVKTDKKGVAKFNTKNLKAGTYRVKITSGNSNYKMSAKSTIKIKK